MGSQTSLPAIVVPSLPNHWPLSKSITTLACCSLVISTAAFVTSMLDLGFTSLWLIPAAYLLTLIHHGLLLVSALVRRNHPDTKQNYGLLPTSMGGLILLGFTMLVWTGAFAWGVVAVMVYSGGDTPLTPANYLRCLLHPIFSAFEFIVLAFILGKCNRERRATPFTGQMRLGDLILCAYPRDTLRGLAYPLPPRL